MLLSCVSQTFQAAAREVSAPWTQLSQPWVLELLWLLEAWEAGLLGDEEKWLRRKVEPGTGLVKDASLIVNHLSWLYINLLSTNLSFNFTTV